MPASSKKIVVYTTEYCPYCRSAKDLLRSKGFDYQEVDVTDDAGQREKLVALSGGRTTVPQIFVDGKPMGGYDDLALFFKNGGVI